MKTDSSLDSYIGKLKKLVSKS